MEIDVRPKAYSYIRLSTEVQLKGHGRQRQIELAEEYADRHGLHLLSDREMEDIGKSAYSGANLKDGALGRFIKAAKEGEIETGTYLLVESLDRISRQRVLDALGTFIEILKAGIVIVTLSDEHVYRFESCNTLDLLISITIMSRAYEESQLKNKRIADAWRRKRDNIKEKKLTAKGPAWLKLNSSKTEFTIDQAKAKIVQSIYNDSAAGFGAFRITERLNAEKIPSLTGKARWSKSSVRKILISRATIGEYQPQKSVRNDATGTFKSVPIGEPISDYYPPIISKELFYKAQDCSARRKTIGAGRKGRNESNIFTGLLRCMYCDSRFHFADKGGTSLRRGRAYLYCDGKNRGLSCHPKRWRYDDFETSFLYFVHGLNLETINPAITANKESERQLQKEKAEIEGQIADRSHKMGNLVELLDETSTAKGYVAARLELQQKAILELQGRLGKIDAELRQIRFDDLGFVESRSEISELVASIKTSGAGDRQRIRTEVASHLKALISEISIASIGSGPLVDRMIADLRDQDDPESVDLLSDLLARRDDEDTNARFFSVLFRNGLHCAVWPDPEDPTRQFKVRYGGSEHGDPIMASEGDEILIKKIDDQDPLLKLANSADAKSLN